MKIRWFREFESHFHVVILVFDKSTIQGFGDGLFYFVSGNGEWDMNN